MIRHTKLLLLSPTVQFPMYDRLQLIGPASFDNVNINNNILISTPDERPPLLKDHFSDSKGVASQEGFHCIVNIMA